MIYHLCLEAFLTQRVTAYDHRFENDLFFPVSLIVVIIEQSDPIPENFPRQSEDLDVIMFSQQLIPFIDPDSLVVSVIYGFSFFPKDSVFIRIGRNFID